MQKSFIENLTDYWSFNSTTTSNIQAKTESELMCTLFYSMCTYSVPTQESTGQYKMNTWVKVRFGIITQLLLLLL